jgi:EmrB/QacA subfamily drug resistance transporter
MSRTVPSTGPGAGASRRLALVVLSAGTLMIILSETIVNVALRSIQSDLGFSQSGLAWVVNAYLIAFGGLLLLAGRLGDLLGRRRIFLAGLAVFAAASLLSGVSGSQQMLIAARFVQGIGGAMTSAVSLGMIVTMFPEPRERARAIGVYSFIGAAGASIGVLAGGVITQVLNWHWVFFVNVPIGVATLALATRVLKPERGIGFGKGADIAGATLVTAGLMLGVFTIVDAADYGWASAHTLGFGAVSLLLLVAFVGRQATAANPLLPLRIFRSRQVSGANLVQALMVAGMFGFQFLSALYLQEVLGYTPAQTGLAFIPITLAIGAISLGLAGPLNTRFGPRTVLLAGLALLVAGLALLARTPVHGDYVVDVLPAMVLLGIGAGLALPPVTMLAMSGATASDSGLASGLANTTQQVGGALGLAALATLATSRTDHLLASGHDTGSALTGGYHLAFGIGAALVAAAMILAAVVLRPHTATPPTPAPGEPAAPGEPMVRGESAALGESVALGASAVPGEPVALGASAVPGESVALGEPVVRGEVAVLGETVA